VGASSLIMARRQQGTSELQAALPGVSLCRALMVGSTISLSACVGLPYEYHPPEALNGTKWGTRIEDVRPQQFLGAHVIDAISCGLPVRS
jgi:hypothetical protein